MISASARGCLAVAGAAVLLSGCPKHHPSEEIANELPPWMTKGEEVRLAVAEKLVESGNTLGALDILRSMRAEGYDGPALDLLQGKALRLDGVTSEAERLLLQAAKREPRDAGAFAELCILYADLHQVDDAIENCERATQVDNVNAAAWNNLGYLRLSNGDREGALEAAEQAMSLDSAESRYRNNLGMAQASLGRTDQAFRTLHSTMGKADAAFMVGLTIERFDGLEAARPWYDKALTYDPNHLDAATRLADDAADTLEPPSAGPPGQATQAPGPSNPDSTNDAPLETP